ncbi:VCBS [Beggiatoa sp. PS]|nr:VCBS [Beggiatoa sp. PS]
MYTPLQGTESGLVVFYDFEEGTGTTATDRTGSHNGTLTNMDEVNWVDGIIGHLTFTTDKNQPLNETLKGYDADGDSLTYSIVTPSSKGTASITDDKTGAFTYTPNNADVIGTDTFTYQVYDGTSYSNSATVTVNIINNVPVIINNAPIAGFGTALDFDGIDDHIVIPGYKGVTGRNSRTIEAWIKTTATSKLAIVTWGNNIVARYWSLQVENLTGFLKITNNGGHIIGSTPLNDGQWHHVACTFENDGSPNVSEAILYVDGQLDTPSSLNSGVINTSKGSEVIIGEGRNDFYKGQMDEVRIWNVARTQAQIQANMYHQLSGNEARLQAYYTFNDGAGNILTDQTANHWDGDLTNMNSNKDWVKRRVSFNTTLNTAFNGMLVGNDVDGDALTYRIVSNPNHGTITNFNSTTGAFTYTPDDWYREVDTFTYQINDGSEDSNLETATINVNPPSYNTGVYLDGQSELVELTIPKAESLIVSISGESERERDWLEILQSNGMSLDPPKKFSGVIEENFVVPGNNTIKVLFTSNDSIAKSGVTVTIDTLPRVSSSDKMCDTNNPLTFSVADFADYFIDPTGNGLETIQILSKPNSGELALSGSAISTGQNIQT